MPLSVVSEEFFSWELDFILKDGPLFDLYVNDLRDKLVI